MPTTGACHGVELTGYGDGDCHHRFSGARLFLIGSREHRLPSISLHLWYSSTIFVFLRLFGLGINREWTPPHTTTVHHHRQIPCPLLIPSMPLQTPNGFFPRNKPLNLPTMRSSIFYHMADRFPARGVFKWRMSAVATRIGWRSSSPPLPKCGRPHGLRSPRHSRSSKRAAVGQNRILAKKPTTDRQISRTRCTHGDTGHKASTALGTARLVRRPWKLKETSNKIPKQ